MKFTSRLIFLLLFVFPLVGSAQNGFQETIGSTKIDVPFSIGATRDSGYIITGHTQYFTSFAWAKDLLMIRLDQNGDTLWERNFGGANDEYGVTGFQSFDGGFAFAGCDASYMCGPFVPGTKSETFFLKTDANGDCQYYAFYGDPNNQNFATAMIQTPDSNFVILAVTYSVVNPQLQDMYVIKIKHSNGDTIWTKRYNTIGADYGYSICSTNDGGFIIAGCTQSLPGLPGFFMKVNSVGNIIWSKSIPCQAENGVSNIYFSCRETADHGIILAGELWTTPANNVEIYLIKTDSAGNALWAESMYPQSEPVGSVVYPTCIEETKDKGFIISAIFASSNNMDDNYVVRTDSLGQVLWSKRYGGPANERHGGLSTRSANDNSLQQYAIVTRSWIAISDENDPQSSFGLTSYTNSFIPSANLSDIYVVKLDNNGESGCNQFTDSAVVIPQTAIFGNFPVTTSAMDICFSDAQFFEPTRHPNLPLNVLCSFTLGLQEPNEISFQLFPNPTNNQLTIKRSYSGTAKISVCNMLGEVVIEKEIEEEKAVINVSGLANGVYFIRIDEGNNSSVQKFMKK